MLLKEVGIVRVWKCSQFQKRKTTEEIISRAPTEHVSHDKPVRKYDTGGDLLFAVSSTGGRLRCFTAQLAERASKGQSENAMRNII